VATFGKLTNGSSSTSSSSDKCVVSAATPATSGTITAASARLWMSSGSTAVRFVIYSDTGGVPDVLLGQSTAVTLSVTTETQIDFTLPTGVDVVQGTQYWIGVSWADPGSPSINISRDGAAGGRYETNTLLPSPFGTPTAQSGPIDVFATYTEATGDVAAATGSSITATAQRIDSAAATAATGSSITATAVAVKVGAATAATGSSITATAQRIGSAAASAATGSAVTATANVTSPVSAAPASGSAVTATAVRIGLASAALTTTAGLTATASVTSPTGSGGVAVNPSVWTVDPSTGALTPLRNWTRLTVTPVRNGWGAVEIEYAAGAPGFTTLDAGVSAYPQRDLEVEIRIGGDSAGRMRALLQQKAGDELQPDEVWTFSGHFMEVLTSEVLVGPQNTPTKEIIFNAATPGTVVATIFDQVKTRPSALAGVARDFTTAADSAGAPWAATISDLKYSPDKSLAEVLGDLVDLGLIEWAVTPAQGPGAFPTFPYTFPDGTTGVLRLWNAGTRGIDRTTTVTPLRFAHGTNLKQADRRESVRTGDAATAVLAKGSDGVYQWATDATALAARGRRVEAPTDAGQTNSAAGVLAAAQGELAVRKNGVAERTHGLVFGAWQPVPRLDFDIGDWALSQTGNVARRLRVAQWSITFRPGQRPEGTVTLNDTITDWRLALLRRLSKVQHGGAVVGTSVPTGPDTLAPAAPTGVTVGSTAYSDGTGGTLAVLHVGWAQVTTNVDTTAADDIAGYRVEWRQPASTGWSFGADEPGGTSTSVDVGDVIAGANVEVRVFAYDSSGNTSTASSVVSLLTQNDTTPPPIPAAPTVTSRLGILVADWTGLGSFGETMPLDLDFVEVHVSAAAGFTPDATTYWDKLSPGGGAMPITDQAYGSTRYVKLIAVDRVGNRSVASAAGSGTATQVVSADLFAGCVGSAALADLAVITAKIDNAAVNDLQVGNVSAGKITTGTLSALLTLSGLIRTNTSPNARMEVDGNGWHSYNSSNVLWADLNVATATMLVTGTYQSGLSGERINILPDGTQRFYGPTGTAYCEFRNEAASGAQAQPFLRLRGFGANATTATMGSLYLASDNATLVWGDYNWGTEPTAVRLDSSTLSTRSPTTILRTTDLNGSLFLGFRNGPTGSDILSASLQHKYVQSRATWLAPSNDCGIRFAGGPTAGTGRIVITDGLGIDAAANHRELTCRSVTQTSSRTGKRDIRPALEVLPVDRAADLVRQVRARSWRPRGYDEPLEVHLHEGLSTVLPQPEPEQVRRHFGFVAEELAEIAPQLIHGHDEGESAMRIAPMEIAAVAWDAAAEAHDDITALAARLTALEARMRND